MRLSGHPVDGQQLVELLQGWAHGLGFSHCGVAGVDLSSAEAGLAAWLAHNFHGRMGYMAAHDMKRARPAELLPGTLSVVTVALPYLPERPPGNVGDEPAGNVRSKAAGNVSRDSVANVPDNAAADGLADPAPPRAPPAGPLSDWQAVEWRRLADPRAAQISVYARGRDYHKVLRARLARLAERLQAVLPAGTLAVQRVFTDSAPVLEVELATRSGIGWRGKHTLALARDGGSMFFLGELFVGLALPPTEPVAAHCGSCTACIDVCPTRAIVAPYRLDARRCISYLTIEHDGPIPAELRAPIGNRVYGCDDCQLVCPWNKYARRSALPDFAVREPLGTATLVELWAWDEAAFLRRTEGGPIRRIGWQRWRRNLAVALGNAWRATGDETLARALAEALPQADALVAEHIAWALAQRAPLPQRTNG